MCKNKLFIGNQVCYAPVQAPLIGFMYQEMRAKIPYEDNISQNKRNTTVVPSSFTIVIDLCI